MLKYCDFDDQLKKAKGYCPYYLGTVRYQYSVKGSNCNYKNQPTSRKIILKHLDPNESKEVLLYDHFSGDNLCLKFII